MRQPSLSTPSRRALLLWSGTALAAGLAGCRSSDILTTDSGTSTDTTEEALAMVNALRAKRGLSPLAADKAAQAAAVIQARRMARADKMAHLIGIRDDFKDRMKASDVALPAAENIAAGQQETARAVTAWIESPKHLKNMLGSYRGLGVAVARDPSSANKPYWAMVLSS